MPVNLSGLRPRLLLLVLLAVLPATVILVIVAYREREAERAQAQDDLLALVHLVADSQEQRIQGARDVLVSVAQLDELYGADLEACSARLAEMYTNYPHYVGFGVFDLNGDRICASSEPDIVNMNVADRPYFQRALSTGDFVVGDFQIGRRVGVPVLGFGYPLRDASGAVVRVLSTGLTLETLNQIVADSPLPAGAVISIIDSQGVILVRDPDAEQWVGQALPEAGVLDHMLRQQEGTLERLGVDGIRRLYAFAPVDTPGSGSVYVNIGLPLEVVYAQASELLPTTLLGIAAVTAMTLMAAWVWTRLFILRPVDELRHATQRVAAGDLSARVAATDDAGELSQLGHAFDSMAASLQRRFDQAQAIHRLTAAVGRAGLLEQVYDEALNSLRDGLGAQRSSILIADAQGILRFAAWRGLSTEYRQAVEGHSPWPAGTLNPPPLPVPDVRLDPSLDGYAAVLAAENIRALGFFPLTDQGRLLGKFMVYYPDPHAFDPGEIELAQTLASHIAFAIQRARLFAEVQAANAQLEERVIARTAELRTANQVLANEIEVRTRAEELLERSREQLRALSARLESAREAERTRMAREIHDELGQQLTGLKMDVARLPRALAGEAGEALRARTESMLALIDLTIHTVRRLATELRPGILDDFGLLAAIEWQAQEFEKRSGITCVLTAGVEEIALDNDRATAVFRIFQETLTNVARHAQATRVDVTLHETAGSLVLSIRDNGRGITPQELDGRGSLGLLGMRERVHLLAGELEIRGEAGQGTSVVVKVPLRPVPAPAAPSVAL